jgi:hypothetical protein
MATSKLVCIHLHVVEIILGSFITPMAIRKLGCIHLYVLQIRFGNYINTRLAARKLDCIHLYVVQISNLKIVPTPHGNKKIGLHPFCMWCKSDLKITLEFEGLANFDNSWKKN